MLREGLRREFPGAFRWVAWVARAGRRVPRPRVARSGTAWAILAGLGADALVTALLGALAGIIFGLVDVPREWQALVAVRAGTIELVGVAAGAAVARRSGGWPALLGFAGTLAILALINIGLAAPGLALFCERAGGGTQFDLCAARSPLEELVARWPTIAGLVSGLLLAARLCSGPRGTNAPLEAIGVVFVLEPATVLVTAPFPPAPAEGWSVGLVLVMGAVYLLVAVVSGHVLVRRGARPWPAGAILAALYFIVPWVPSLLLYARFPSSAPPAEYAWLTLNPVGNAVAFVLGAVVSAAFARPRPPGADAARRGAR